MGPINRDKLVYTLDRLALGFESADPRVRAECKRVAIQNFRRMDGD